VPARSRISGPLSPEISGDGQDMHLGPLLPSDLGRPVPRVTPTAGDRQAGGGQQVAVGRSANPIRRSFPGRRGLRTRGRAPINGTVKFDLTHPTEGQVRDSLISGIVAEAIAIPVVLAVVFVNPDPVKWGYIAAALACIVVSIVYLALFVVITKGGSESAQANVGFTVMCLALSALGFIELASSNRFGAYTPAVLVGVTFVCVIGDRRMRIAIDIYAIALVTIISWAEGLRGADLMGMVIVYASTIVIITWIIARAMSSLTGDLNFRHAIDALNEALEDVNVGDVDPSGNVDPRMAVVQSIFHRGLPLVGDILRTDVVAVFVRHAKQGRFVPLVVWPLDREDVSELAVLPELDQALRADAAALGPRHCVIPVGYSLEGELFMVIRRPEDDRNVDHRTEEAARLLAMTFLRVTSRANFVTGLHAESRTDPLTGLANRRSLYERIEIEMEHALRGDAPLTIAMIDLDHFKQYNDQFGHVAGDTVLRSVAAVMVSNTRGQDLVARYGGEEFCLVLPDTDLVGGHHILDQLRAGGRETKSDLPVTLSAGLTSWDGVEEVNSFIERADQALYRAKETGRDRVVSIQAVTEF
jgi:diguanylate cyclase (GGDEF)-like protein